MLVFKKTKNTRSVHNTKDTTTNNPRESLTRPSHGSVLPTSKQTLSQVSSLRPRSSRSRAHLFVFVFVFLFPFFRLTKEANKTLSHFLSFSPDLTPLKKKNDMKTSQILFLALFPCFPKTTVIVSSGHQSQTKTIWYKQQDIQKQWPMKRELTTLQSLSSGY